MSAASAKANFGREALTPRAIWLPLKFMLAGIVALITGFTLIAVRPEILSTYHYNQYVVSVTHVFVLGWIGSVAMGAMYQLVPIALETKLHNERLAELHFWMHLIGVVGMIWFFWVWDMKQVGHYGSLVALGVGVFAYNLIRTLRTVPRWNVIAGAIAASLFWLTLGVLAGLYVVAAKCWSFSPFSPIAQMHAHAHLGVIGFFLQLMIGVSFKLVPMFTLSEIQNQRRAWGSLILLNIGLAGSFAGILFQAWWKWIFALVIIVGLVGYAVELAAIIRARKRKGIDAGVKYFITAVALLVPTIGLGALLSWPKLPVTELTAQLENLYGFLALAGVLTLGIIGMLYKIVSFLVWYGRYSREVGKCKTPSLTDLYSAILQTVSYWIFLAGLLVTSCGIIQQNNIFVRSGAIIFCVSLGLFTINVVKILSHLCARQLEALPIRATAGGVL